jgi:iron complex transport system ATP-binding protein
VLASGPIDDTLTAATLSACFGLTLVLQRHGQRWSAWAT